MIFVVSSFWLALNRPRDDHHAEAVALAGRELGPLVTSDRVPEETWTLVLRRTRRHDIARRVTTAIRETEQVRLVPVAGDIARRSWDWLDAHQALTFDDDVAAAGFVVIHE